MAQTVQLRLSRNPGQPWGFRLQGGKDFNMPVVIQKVNGSSPAEQSGMRAGDAVITIAGQNAMDLRHKEVQDVVVSSGNSIDITVQRGGQSSLRLPPVQTSLPKPSQTPKHRNPFSSFQKVETTDGSVKSLVHNQFNSPLPLYSEEKIAETLSAQAEVLSGGAMGVDFRKNEKKFDSNMSDVLRMVKQMDEDPDQFQAPSNEIDHASYPTDYSSFNAVKSRSLRSLVVSPEEAHLQHGVHAPRINTQQPVSTPMSPAAPAPAPKVGPPVPPKPCPPGGMQRGPPGMRSTAATVIRRDPVSGGVKLTTAVDTETKHFNAFNRTPQSFKPSMDSSSTLPFNRAPQLSPHAQMQSGVQQFPGQTQLSQVDYTSYIPQRKGGTSFMWPPQQTEECPQTFIGAPAEVRHPVHPQQPPPCPSFASAPLLSGMSQPKQVTFSHSTLTSSAAATNPAPPPAASSYGGTPKLGSNGAAPDGSTGGAAPGGKGTTAGRTNAPRRGRGQRGQAGPGLRIAVCATCGNQIRGPFITALGQCWCPGCFVCSTPQCRQNLENIGFVEVAEKIHCELCWENNLAPTCSKCRKRIKEDCLKAVGTCYHPECFACAYCGGLFGNSAFFLEDGLPYCENDWNELFTTKCNGCGFPIEAGDRWVEALNKNFHAQCFKCAICGSNLEGQSFLSKQGRPFCKHHARM